MSVWYEQAKERLNKECKEVKGQKERAMSSAVRDALLDFCRQNEEFAQAVAQGGSFPDCMKAVANGVGGSISDLAAYRRAASFYFDGAKVKFQMAIQLEPAETEPDRGGLLLNRSDFCSGGGGDVLPRTREGDPQPLARRDRAGPGSDDRPVPSLPVFPPGEHPGTGDH